jgi:hypothetical protein
MKTNALIKKYTVYLIALLFLSLINTINAQVSSAWIGSIDSDFYNVNNWNNTNIDFANAQSTTLTIGPGIPNNPIQEGGNGGNLNYRPNYLNIYAGSNITFNGVLIPWNNTYMNGIVTLNEPADINFRSAVYLAKDANGTLNINGGNINSKNQFYIGYGTTGNALVNVLGGGLSTESYLEVATNGTSTGILNISGGTVTVAVGINIGSNGSINISDLGALIVTGDHTVKLNDYISTGNITSPVGTNLAVTFDGTRTTVAISQDPTRLIKEFASYIILDNGILQARIDKASSNIESLKVNGVETLATSNPANSGRVGTYYDFTGSYGFDKISGTVFSIKEETDDFIDVSFKRTYSDGIYLAPCDADIHYVLKKNDKALYNYSILHHKPEYPSFDLGSWRQVIWIANDGTNYLTEKIYVTDTKKWQMPSVYDFSQASSTGIPEIVKLNTGVRAGEYDGKYQFSENYMDLSTWGHASDVNNIGSWAVTGSHEYFPGGPTSHDLNAAAGIIHVLLTNVHYNSKEFVIPQGEDWSKIYGPFLIYTSEESTGDANWADAKLRAEQERSEWPYSWLTNTPEYPLSDGRGNIVGNFSITDPAKPEIDGSNAWIGVTQLNSASGGDWQFESKSYQYWVKTDASGNFDIQHIRPGTYTLFAFKDGEIDEYRMDNVTVTAGGINNLGNINWTIPRNSGNLVWEIGVPNRTSEEFKFGDYEYCEGFTEYTFENNFPNPIEYNVADKNWSDVIPYAHTKYIRSNGNRDAWHWNFNFELTGSIPTTGNAKLTIAFASADYSQFWLYANGSTIYQTYLNSVPTGGNALIRQSNHAKYGIQTFNIPYNKLKIGQNTLTFLMPSNQNPSHLMYDYIGLEGNLTAVLSTDDFDLNKTVKAFPNPSSGLFEISLPKNFSEVKTELYSLNGALISKQNHIVNQDKINLNISNKPAGIYFLRVLLDEPVTIKIVKNK